MVTITAPLSKYVDNNDSSTYTLQWTNSYTGQYAFEVMYKLKRSSSWLTTGKITSTATSYDLRNLHTLTGVDIDEVQYRLVVYYMTTEGIETKDFSDAAYMYSLVFNSGKSGHLNIWDGEKAIQMPLMGSISNAGIKKLNIMTASGVKQVPIVESDSPLAGKVMIQTADGPKHLAVKEPVFVYDTTKLQTYGTVTASYRVASYSSTSYNVLYNHPVYSLTSAAYRTYAARYDTGYYYNLYNHPVYSVANYAYRAYTQYYVASYYYDGPYPHAEGTAVSTPGYTYSYTAYRTYRITTSYKRYSYTTTTGPTKYFKYVIAPLSYRTVYAYSYSTRRTYRAYYTTYYGPVTDGAAYYYTTSTRYGYTVYYGIGQYNHPAYVTIAARYYTRYGYHYEGPKYISYAAYTVTNVPARYSLSYSRYYYHTGYTYQSGYTTTDVPARYTLSYSRYYMPVTYNYISGYSYSGYRYSYPVA